MRRTLELPAELVSSEEFKSLNEKQVASFEQRLGYIREIAQQIDAIGEAETSEGLYGALDNLELDVTSAAAPRAREEQQPSYLIHSSWTFECKSQEMAAHLPDVLLAGDTATMATSTLREAELLEWLRRTAHRINIALEGFYGATSFCSSIGHLIAIDAVIAELQSGLARARLNPTVRGR